VWLAFGRAARQGLRGKLRAMTLPNNAQLPKAWSVLDSSHMIAMDTDAFRFDFFAMGSPCEISIYGSDRREVATVASEAISEVRRIECRYSRYRVESILSTINSVAQSGGRICLDSETANLVDHAFEAHTISGGLFDVTCGVVREIWNDNIEATPSDAKIALVLDRVGLEKVEWRRPELRFPVPGMELDFGGLAKEYAADRAAAVCRLGGSLHGLVNLGGDIAVVGPHPDGSPWRIGIRDPLGGDAAAATLFVANGGIATSGSYERYWEIEGRRYSHAINPRTGWPVEGLPSITVVAETCLSAGKSSTIALLQGESGPQWLSATGAVHLYVEASGRLGGSILG
jgi:thiamine biosynthesis lipoprotein